MSGSLCRALPRCAALIVAAWLLLTAVASAASPGVVSRAPGTLDVFTRNPQTGALQQAYWTAEAGWSNWIDHGGGLSPESDIAAISRYPGHLSVFVRGTDDALYEKWWSDSSGWSGWQRLGGVLTGGPSAAAWNHERQDVFVRSTSGSVAQIAWTPQSGWTGWHDLGGVLAPGTGPAVGTRAPGYLDVAVTGTDRAMYIKSYRPDTGWFPYYRINSWLAGGPGVASQRGDWNGRQDYVGISSTNGVAQYTYLNGGFHGWTDLSGVVPSNRAPAPIWWNDATNAGERFDVFTYGTDANVLYQRTWTAGQGWGGWGGSVPRLNETGLRYNDDDAGAGIDDDDDPTDVDLVGEANEGRAGRNRWKLDAKGAWTPIRNARQSLVIGNLPDFTLFDEADRDGGYSGGWAYDVFSGCGWIQFRNRGENVGTGRDRCGANNGRIAPTRFASLINCDQCNTGTVIPKLRGKAMVGYRNVRPWSADPSPSTRKEWTAGQNIAWRYVTRDGRWVLVSDSVISPSAKGGANNVFVRRSDIPLDVMCRRKDPGPIPAQKQGHGDWPRVCSIGTKGKP